MINMDAGRLVGAHNTHHITDIDDICVLDWRDGMPALGWSVKDLKTANCVLTVVRFLSQQ